MNNPDESVDIFKFVNPPLLKNGDSITVRTWSFTPEVPLSISELVDMEKRMKETFLRNERCMYDEIINGNGYTVMPSDKPAIYDQNYKSAVLDKDGKFVRKIE